LAKWGIIGLESKALGTQKNKISKLSSFRGFANSLRFLAVLWNHKKLDDYFFPNIAVFIRVVPILRLPSTSSGNENERLPELVEGNCSKHKISVSTRMIIAIP
jgi:hypothetical protein